MIDAPRFSFVVPALNESASLPRLFGEIERAVQLLGDDAFEIILVDDGSTDDTRERVQAWTDRFPQLRYIRFRRNRGKSDAYVVGFRACRGQIVATLDADLQDDPGELPKLLAALEQGADLVVGSKHGRLRNEPMKALASRPFNGLLSLLFRMPMRDSNSGYRMMQRDCAESLITMLYGDLYRFIPQIAHTLGFRVVEVDVVHRARSHGHSKFGATRFWTGLLDAVTTFFLLKSQRRPLHFFATLGLLPLLCGAGLEVYALAAKLSGESFQEHIAAIIIGVLLITLGVHASLTGLLAELLVSNRNAMRQMQSARFDSLRPPPVAGYRSQDVADEPLPRPPPLPRH